MMARFDARRLCLGAARIDSDPSGTTEMFHVAVRWHNRVPRYIHQTNSD